jgi:ABC-type polysaccharide/polyol phosphate transport system ATPase subunit
MLPSIIVNNISKKYKIGTGLTNFRELFSLRKGNNDNKYHWAVKNVGFELRPGESLGIIGPNGAGKTTILKMLSRVTQPTSGDIHVNGRLSALIELGAGFHPDLTGRENVYLNGAILGMHRSDIKKRFEKIIDFAGIGEYLDTPVKRYSSGMYARLGFAIAAHMDPEVLLVDEVLAVGDFAFQTKCYARMDELRTQGTALILVSHNFEAVRRVCDRGLVLYRGESIFQGTSAEAIVAYSEALRSKARESQIGVPKEGGLGERVMTFDAEVKSVSLFSIDGQPVSVLQSGSSARIIMEIQFNKNVHQPIFAFTIRTPDGILVYNITTQWMGIKTPDFLAGERCHVEFDINLSLLDGTYELGVDVTPSSITHFYDRLEFALGFSIVGSQGAKGLVDLGTKVAIKKFND